MKKLTLFLFFILSTTYIYSQNNITQDSITREIKTRNVLKDGPVITSQNSPYQAQQYYDLPGDKLINSGKMYLIGAGLTVTGGAITYIGADNNNKDIIIVGGAVALSGFICTVIGHIEIIKAGKALNEAVTLNPASKGIGLAINF